MVKHSTEMLKGVLEGMVLARLSQQPAHGYEITSWLRDEGLTEVAEGTIYALLLRIEQRELAHVEKVPSQKGPPRKVYTLSDVGAEQLDRFWATWTFLAERLDALRPHTHESREDAPS